MRCPSLVRGEPLRCPNDGARLVEIVRSGVLLDACPECRGVWLDRGELDKKMEGRRREQRNPERRDDDRGSRKHRGRGLLGELLDL